MRTIRNLARFNLGAVISILGCIGLTFRYFSRSSWHEVINFVSASIEVNSQVIYGFANVLPLMLVVIGGALMLSARNES